MEHKCNKCGCNTEGFKITINGVSDFMCLTCKTTTEYMQEVNNNRSCKYGGVELVSSWKNKDFGTGLK